MGVAAYKKGKELNVGTKNIVLTHTTALHTI